MSENSGSFDRLAVPEPSSPLADRVRDRVLRARGSLDRRDGATIRRGRESALTAVSDTGSDGKTPMSREVRALRMVFRELGRTARQYRRRTHAPISGALRSAAIAFKQEPSLISLVPVAGFLDEMQLLKW
jgi:hypothetical protein